MKGNQESNATEFVIKLHLSAESEHSSNEQGKIVGTSPFYEYHFPPAKDHFSYLDSNLRDLVRQAVSYANNKGCNIRIQEGQLLGLYSYEQMIDHLEPVKELRKTDIFIDGMEFFSTARIKAAIQQAAKFKEVRSQIEHLDPQLSPVEKFIPKEEESRIDTLTRSRIQTAHFHPNNIRAIRHIVELKAEGLTEKEIAEKLNDEGLRTTREKQFRQTTVNRLFNIHKHQYLTTIKKSTAIKEKLLSIENRIIGRQAVPSIGRKLVADINVSAHLGKGRRFGQLANDNISLQHLLDKTKESDTPAKQIPNTDIQDVSVRIQESKGKDDNPLLLFEFEFKLLTPLIVFVFTVDEVLQEVFRVHPEENMSEDKRHFTLNILEDTYLTPGRYFLLLIDEKSFSTQRNPTSTTVFYRPVSKEVLVASDIARIPGIDYWYQPKAQQLSVRKDAGGAKEVYPSDPQ